MRRVWFQQRSCRQQTADFAHQQKVHQIARRVSVGYVRTGFGLDRLTIAYLGNLLHVGYHLIVTLGLLTEPRQESLAFTL
jgi:hypothetical protein